MSALPVSAHAVAVGGRTEQLLEVLVRAQQRESELEAAYAEDRATPAQLVELERVRGKIERCLEALEELGYFTPS